MDEITGRPHWAWAWLTLLGGLASGALGTWFAVKWVTTDEVDVYGPCSRGSGTCLEGGETLNMTFTLVWGGLGLLGVVFGLALLVRNRRRAAADRRLLASGRRTDALVTDVRERGSVTRTNGRITSRGYLLTVDPADGGAPLILKVELPPGVRPGVHVRVVFDPITRDAALLEDPSEATSTGFVLA